MNQDTVSIVDIYTDGACSGNPGPGGWGAILRYNGKDREMSGSHPATTNNRMEMMAAIEAIETLKRKVKVRVYTDSRYLQDGMNQWIHNWKRRNWKTADNKEVKNKDLWQRLDIACQRHDVDWNWVRGHDGHPENERADFLARNAIIAAMVESER